MQTRLIIGAMSGTSADGVDVALAAIEGNGTGIRVQLEDSVEHPYPKSLREKVFHIRAAPTVNLGDLASLASEIANAYADAVDALLTKARRSAGEVTAIAAHGQTLFHAPPLTIQWIDPALLAHRTGIDVISDFRRADCAAGGQGAPLVPYADSILFRDPSIDRIILNIGGIANITWLRPDSNEIIAFDTGPGNCVIDHLCRKHFPGGPGYDANGTIAANGNVDQAILDQLCRMPYLNAPFPKSADTPAMIAYFEKVMGDTKLSPESQIATATQWTSISIQQAILRLASTSPRQVIIAGGGTRNAHLLQSIRSPVYEMLISDEIGVPSQAREALAFAILGAATLDRVPANVLSVTGANKPVILGSITLARPL